MTLTKLLRPSVIGAGPYEPGAGARELKARTGRDDLVRLNWNENLLGPLDGVLDAVAAALPDAAWVYPEEAEEEFREAVAAWTGAAPEQVLPGHGIQALTVSIVQAFIDPGDRVVIPRPTYGLYAAVCAAAGATVHRVGADPGQVTHGDALALDLERVAATATSTAAKLVFVCDPNNPTGLRLTRSEWDAFLDALPAGCIVIADEAYVDYVEPAERIDRLADVSAGRPVVVMRSFSKMFGLAGLRLGYLLVHESLTPHLHAVQEPFNVNGAALAAGIASLDRVEQLPARRAQAALARGRLVAPLQAAGLRPLPSSASFVLVDLAGADDVAVCEAVAREGLLLRAGSEFGLSGYVRVTIGPAELMDRVAGTLVKCAQDVTPRFDSG